MFRFALSYQHNELHVVQNCPSAFRCARDDQWLLLYLSAVKLLETLLRLSSQDLPQFQM